MDILIYGIYCKFSCLLGENHLSTNTIQIYFMVRVSEERAKSYSNIRYGFEKQNAAVVKFGGVWF